MVGARSGLWVRLAAALAAGCCGLPAFAAEALHGAGATFPAPVYAAWSNAYRQSTGVEVTYEAVGSGAGLERIRRNEVDFGASDAPLTADQLSAFRLVQFPVVIGGVVPVINISGIKPGQLRLSGAVLAEIYLGHIRKWNDAAIASLNPAQKLPSANITVVHRSDSSGTTLLWTDYLSRSSKAWQTAVGASLDPRWPEGSGGVGNEGVASYVQRTRFAIGYVEYAYARSHRLSDVGLRNRSGSFVQAGQETFRAATKSANWNPLAPAPQLETDLPGEKSWPIVGASFILVGASPEHGERTRAVLKFFDWASREGKSITDGLDYVPLPESAIERLPMLWGTIRDGTGKSVWP